MTGLCKRTKGWLIIRLCLLLPCRSTAVVRRFVNLHQGATLSGRAAKGETWSLEGTYTFPIDQQLDQSQECGKMIFQNYCLENVSVNHLANSLNKFTINCSPSGDDQKTLLRLFSSFVLHTTSTMTTALLASWYFITVHSTADHLFLLHSTVSCNQGPFWCLASTLSSNYALIEPPLVFTTHWWLYRRLNS